MSIVWRIRSLLSRLARTADAGPEHGMPMFQCDIDMACPSGTTFVDAAARNVAAEADDE